MNKNVWLDKYIKNAITCEDEKIPLSYGPLEKVKQRLKNDDMAVVRIDMHSLLKKRTMKFSLIFVLIFILLGGVIGVGAVTLFKTDIIDYPFVVDPQIIGKWQSVGFVKSIDEFNPDMKFKEELYIKELAFINNGKILVSINEGNGVLAYSSLKWTKGIVINIDKKTASKYEVMDINGLTYMFYEWKSGDYLIGGLQPYLYVFKKIDSNDYSSYQVNRKVDNINYPFTDDPQVIGKWNSVGYVKKISNFNPKRESQIPLYLLGLIFGKDGKLVTVLKDGDFSGGITWTKGLVLDQIDQTASAYVIKEIKGSTYLFIEWKSGDYVFRGMEPYYYVLKKE